MNPETNYQIDPLSDYGSQSLLYDYKQPRISKKPRKWPAITPDMHKKIKLLYRHKVCHSGEVNEFAAQHRLPRWKITRYAQEMGWTAKQKKMPNWTDRELQILKQSAHHCPDVIQKRLKKIGFERSLHSIVLKRKRMRFLQNLNGQSATSLAICLGEDVHFVLRAIRLGLLKASKRIQNRTPQQGGSAWLIKDGDVKDFIIENVHIIDLRKVDKYWFISLLTDKDLT